MDVGAALADEVFAGNRALGRIALAAVADRGVTRRARVHEAGALRVRFPNGSGQALDAVIVNTAGGMTGGDRFDIEANVGAGAEVTVTTAAAAAAAPATSPPAAAATAAAITTIATTVTTAAVAMKSATLAPRSPVVAGVAPVAPLPSLRMPNR